MSKRDLRAVLSNVENGTLSVDQAMRQIGGLSYTVDPENYLCLDTARQNSSGVPEIIYGASKTPEQILSSVKLLSSEGRGVLASRVDARKAALVMEQGEDVLLHCKYDAMAQCLWIDSQQVAAGDDKKNGNIVVVSAGTSDAPIAQEIVITARFLGCSVELVSDVGVASIGRVFGHLDLLRTASVVIVVAGMEGALPSVVAGLVMAPVIAVATSVGYGVGMGGFAAMLGMLSSCSPGILCVNIDNGVGAAVAASLILDVADRTTPEMDRGL